MNSLCGMVTSLGRGLIFYSFIGARNGESIIPDFVHLVPFRETLDILFVVFETNIITVKDNREVIGSSSSRHQLGRWKGGWSVRREVYLRH